MTKEEFKQEWESDRCDYPYVCFECDEGHYFIELINGVTN